MAFCMSMPLMAALANRRPTQSHWLRYALAESHTRASCSCLGPPARSMGAWARSHAQQTTHICRLRAGKPPKKQHRKYKWLPEGPSSLPPPSPVRPAESLVPMPSLYSYLPRWHPLLSSLAVPLPAVDCALPTCRKRLALPSAALLDLLLAPCLLLHRRRGHCALLEKTDECQT